MIHVKKIREQLEAWGFKPDDREEFEALGIELTICQMIVIGTSFLSVVFLFTPLFYLQDIWFMVVFYALSLLVIIGGVWFWVNRADICENPQYYQGP